MVPRPNLPGAPARRRPYRALHVALGAVAAAVSLAVVPAGAGAAMCADVDSSPTEIGTARAAAAVACLVNHERQAAGLSTLTIDSRVRTAAQRYADDMAARDFFAHVSPEGTDPGVRLKAAGFNWQSYGENLAQGQQTAREAMTAWLASPGHCRNLMTPGYAVAGYGVTNSSRGPYWVQEFGRSLVSGVFSLLTPTPSCPRTPTPLGTTPPPPAAPAASTASQRAAAKARRSGRSLRLDVKLPGASAPVRMVVRVVQGGRTVRTLRLTRAPGSTHRLSVRLRAPRAGIVTVRAGAAPTVRARFR